MADNPFLRGALYYAGRNWPVFPIWGVKKGRCACGKAACEHPGKHPIGKLAPKGRNSATTDPKIIRAWWRLYPPANIGIPTGPESGLVVVDIDPRNGGNRGALERLGDFPPTPTAQTGGGGEHILLRHPGQKIKSKSGLGGFPGIDQKGDGGYIVAPPSNHISGGVYSWKIKPDTPLADIPAWLMPLLLQGEAKPQAQAQGRQQRTAGGVACPTGTAAPPGGAAGAVPGGEFEKYTSKALTDELTELARTPAGGRNARLNQAAYALGQLVGAGVLDRGSVEADLSGVAASIGLGEVEARLTIKSGIEAGCKEPRQLPERAITRGSSPGQGKPPASPEKGHQEGEDEAEKLKKKVRPPPPVATGGLTFSDLGNARRLVAKHGQDLRYCYLSKKWYVWTGKCWEVDNRGEVERRAKQVVGAIYREAAESDNLKRREALGQWALRSEDKRRIQAMVALAQSEPGIPVLPRDFDTDSWLLNCGNGTIDLRIGELRPHKRADLLTCQVPADFDAEAACPVWEKFVYEIQAENIEIYNFLQRILGYALTGETSEQCLFILWGTGANGKSTLINLVTRLLGSYARNTPVETLLDKRRGGDIPIDVARLDGPRLVTGKEVDRGRRLSESLIKELTGQDTVSARFLYGEYFDFIPKFKLFLSTNHKPVIRGTDNAIWRRIKLIRFPVQFSEDQCDQELAGKLWAEAPGILNWLVMGCLSWQRLGLEVPAEVKETTAEFRAEMDILADFMGDRCSIGMDKSAWAKDLYEAYKDWAEEQGLSEKERMRQRSFGMSLSERGFRRQRSTHGRHIWHGLRLLRDNEYPGGNV